MKDKNQILHALFEKNRLLMGLIVSCVYIMIFILNHNYPLFLDDYVYSFIYLSDHRVESILDILKSQYIHYFAWGGRNVVHFICQFLLMIDFFWACVLNTTAYIVFIYIIYRIANKNKKLNPIIFFLIHACLWFLQPAFCQAVLWKTGSANYLWGALIVISFIYPYYSYYRNKNSSNNILKNILFFIAGIIAGWTNENVSIALIVYILGSIVLYRIERMDIPKWAIFGLLGAIIGCAVMVSAPGNYVRMFSITEYYKLRGTIMTELYIPNIKRLLLYSLTTILPLLTVYIVGCFIYNRQMKDKHGKEKVIRSSVLFILTGFIAFLGLLASPTSETRALFGTISLFIIPTVLIYANIDFKINRILQILNITILTAFFVLSLVDYNWKYKTLKIAADIWKDRLILIDEYKKKGIDTITFNNRIKAHPKYGIWDLNDSINESCSKYYGFKSMKSIDPHEKK